MPEQWGSRPTWLIDGEEPEPYVSPWLFWITVGLIVGGCVGWAAWRLFR